jgi:hypothetical protein
LLAVEFALIDETLFQEPPQQLQSGLNQASAGDGGWLFRDRLCGSTRGQGRAGPQLDQ